ncbi:MAG TPA: PVC-type heme-binding CxxCH protein [Verrucomicrobiae bacterium]|nr:PVC-type heme-binding CxxCH protein [Verrucomicrobiae bacterium]
MRLQIITAVCFVVCVKAATIKIEPQTFTVPDGFVIERVAGPPLVDRPIVADFDEKGRLYVADSSGSNDKTEKQVVDKPHRIVRLEDTNGDGRFDKMTVFADKMMFPEGAMWLNGSLYVAAPPSIWKLTDTNNDGVADQREEWFKGKTLTGCANDLHGPYRGPDGWIYWCKGAFAKQTYEREGKAPFITRAAHIFRARPDGSGIEPVMTGGMDNPVDVVFTPSGERIFTTTFFQHPGGGKRDGLVHAIYGGVYGKVHDVIDDHKRTSSEVMPVLTHLGPAAPCGLTRYESGAFGSDYQGNLFACNFNLHKITRHVLEPDGATYKTRDSDFLVSDNTDFHPTDVIEATDGSLLVMDTGGWYKLCCPTSQLPKPDVLGAIYRIRKLNATPIPKPNPNDIWALIRRGDRAGVHASLNTKDPVVQQAALHGISLWRDTETLPTVIPKLKDSNPHTQRIAAEALGRIGDPKAVPALLEAAATKHDRALEHSITYALIEIADAKTTAAGLQAKSVETQRAALIALDQMDNGNLQAEAVIKYLDSKDPLLKDTAYWIVSHHAEWGEKLAKYFRDADVDPQQLASLARNTAIQDLIADLVHTERCDVALRAMAKSGLKAAPEEWVNGLIDVLHRDGQCIREAIAACRSLTFAKEHAPKIAEALKATPLSVRLEALAALPGTGHEMSTDSFQLVCAKLDGNALAKAKLNKNQLLTLAPRLKEAGPLDLPKVLAPFENCSDEKVGETLLSSLRETKGLYPDLLKRLAKFPEPVQKELNALSGSLNADVAKQKAHLEALLGSLKDGDIRRGQAVFNSTKAACSTCHAIGYLGGTLGPDLTRIGQVRTDRDLLESVLYPSASFVRSFEPVIVSTKAGDEYSGVLRKDSADEVILGTGANLEVRVPRSDIAEMRPGSVSVMPQGLDQQITKQELADLIAFLRATRW